MPRGAADSVRRRSAGHAEMATVTARPARNANTAASRSSAGAVRNGTDAGSRVGIHAQRERRQPHAGHAASDGQQPRVHEEQPGQPDPAGAESGPCGQFAAALLEPRHLQCREVRARDEEHGERSGEQHQQRSAHVAHELLAERHRHSVVAIPSPARLKAFNSASACAAVAPGRSRPRRQHVGARANCKLRGTGNRDQNSPGSASTATRAGFEGQPGVTRSGMMPTTVYGSPPSRTSRPTISGAPPNRPCHIARDRRTTRGAPGARPARRKRVRTVGARQASRSRNRVDTPDGHGSIARVEGEAGRPERRHTLEGAYPRSQSLKRALVARKGPRSSTRIPRRRRVAHRAGTVAAATAPPSAARTS